MKKTGDINRRLRMWKSDVQEWVNSNPGKRLTKVQKAPLAAKWMLIDPKRSPPRTDVHAGRAVQYQIQRIRPIINNVNNKSKGDETCGSRLNTAKRYIPENTKKNYIIYAKKNPEKIKKNNKKNNKKTTDKRREENLKYIKSNPKLVSKLMSLNDLEAKAQKIYTSPNALFGGMSPQQALRSGKYGIYCGVTKRSLLEEAERWLERRGAHQNLRNGRKHTIANYDPSFY